MTDHVDGELEPPQEPGGHERREQQHQRGGVPDRVLDAEDDDQVDEVAQQDQAEGGPPADPLADHQGDGGHEAGGHGRAVQPALRAVAQHVVDEQVDAAHEPAEHEQQGEGESGDPVLGTARHPGGTGATRCAVGSGSSLPITATGCRTTGLVGRMLHTVTRPLPRAWTDHGRARRRGR